MTLTLNTGTSKIILNILQGPDENSIVIPPRSEVIRNFLIKSNTDVPRYVPNQELVQGVFTANTIVNPKYALVRVINTTNQTKIID
jgi:hypothetical protein